MKIRKENSSDYEKIYNLVKEAFESATHSDGNEQDLVNELRGGNSFIPELSLVATENGEIIGHILFTKANVGNEEVLVLAPLSVLPKFQNKGIGSALIKEGHNIAKSLGYEYSFVLGDNNYYSRFSYIPATNFNVLLPEGILDKYFMAKKLIENPKSISGKLIYAKEFNIE